VLIDCHPVPEPSAIEIRAATGVTRVGELVYSEEFKQTISEAENSLELLGQQKVFKNQRSTDYTFLIHFESATDFFDYFEYWASYYEPLPRTLMKKIEQRSAHPGTEIVLDTRCKSTAFKKLA